MMEVLTFQPKCSESMGERGERLFPQKMHSLKNLYKAL
jgi:hypothetical protein